MFSRKIKLDLPPQISPNDITNQPKLTIIVIRALFGWWVIDIYLISHHPKIITQNLSPCNSFFITWKSSTYTQLCLALKPSWVFILKTQKPQLFVGPTNWLGAVKTKRLPAWKGTPPVLSTLLLPFFFLHPQYPHETQKLSSPLTKPKSYHHLHPCPLKPNTQGKKRETKPRNVPMKRKENRKKKINRNQTLKPNVKRKEKRTKKKKKIETKPRNPKWKGKERGGKKE